MTPQDVRAMTVPEYLAFVKQMNEEIRERNRQIRKANKRGR